MSNRLNLSVTRSNLLRIKEELEFAQEGCELLEQKREVLVDEVVRMLDSLRKSKKEVEKLLDEAYRSLEQTSVSLGMKKIHQITLAACSREKISIRDRSIMGVIIPVVDYSRENKLCNIYGFQGTSAGLDKTVHLFCSSLKKLAKLAELEVSLIRLATELKKTQRRANALNYLFIPQYSETNKYLENTLEEKERQELFQLKRAKHIHQNNS